MYRERTKDKRTPIRGKLSFTFPVTGLPRRPDAFSTTLAGDTAYFNDYVTPGFDRKSAQGQIINNPLSSRKTTLEVSNDPWQNYLGPTYSGGKPDPASGWLDSGTMLGTNLCPSFLPLPFVNVNRLIQLASAQARSNVDASKATALVTIAEAQKTYASVQAILQRAISIARAIRKADLAFLAGQLKPKEIEDRYMEYRYAIRPLVADLNNVCKAWNESRHSRTRLTARGRAQDSGSVSDAFIDTTRFGSTDLTCSRQSNINVEVRCGILYDVDTSALSKLQTWGGMDIASSAWELVPFSFIIDWFCNVGTVVSAWQPKPFARELASWTTVTTTVTQTSRVTGVSPRPNVIANQESRGRTSSGSGCVTQTYVDKVRSPGLPKVNYPQVDINLDFFKILDLVSILRKIL